MKIPLRCKIGFHHWSEPVPGYIAICNLCGGVRRTGDTRTRYAKCSSCKGTGGDWGGPCWDCRGTGVEL